MLNPREVQYLMKETEKEEPSIKYKILALYNIIQALALSLSEMADAYDSARDSLRDCGSEECDAFGEIKTKLDDPVLQEWLDRARKDRTTIKIQFRNGKEKKLVKISYDEARKMADLLLHYTEEKLSVTLDVEALPKDNV